MTDKPGRTVPAPPEEPMKEVTAHYVADQTPEEHVKIILEAEDAGVWPATAPPSEEIVVCDKQPRAHVKDSHLMGPCRHPKTPEPPAPATPEAPPATCRSKAHTRMGDQFCELPKGHEGEHDYYLPRPAESPAPPAASGYVNDKPADGPTCSFCGAVLTEGVCKSCGAKSAEDAQDFPMNFALQGGLSVGAPPAGTSPPIVTRETLISRARKLKEKELGREIYWSTEGYACEFAADFYLQERFGDSALASPSAPAPQAEWEIPIIEHPDGRAAQQTALDHGMSPIFAFGQGRYHEGWQTAHDPMKCGHPRACYQDRNYPESEKNYDPETHSSDPPMDYRCVICEAHAPSAPAPAPQAPTLAEALEAMLVLAEMGEVPAKKTQARYRDLLIRSGSGKITDRWQAHAPSAPAGTRLERVTEILVAALKRDGYALGASDAETIWRILKMELGAKAAGTAPTPPSEQLVIDLCRELYDRFVMGGWGPQDAHEQVRHMLAEARASAPPEGEK